MRPRYWIVSRCHSPSYATGRAPTLHTSSYKYYYQGKDGVLGSIFLLRSYLHSAVAEYANAGPCFMIYGYFYLNLGIITWTVSVWMKFIFYIFSFHLILQRLFEYWCLNFSCFSQGKCVWYFIFIYCRMF